MEKIKKSLGSGVTRLSEIVTFWTALPAGAVALMSGYLSSGVSWIAALGPFGVFSAGLMGFFLSSLGLAAITKNRLWRLQVDTAKRLIGESSPFDPMESIFVDKRIKIADLINPYDQIIIGKKFINCELIGPANIIPMLGNGKFTGNRFDQSDSVEIRNDAKPSNAIGFVDCDIENCRFFRVTIFWQQGARKIADEIITSQNWLTVMEDSQLALEDRTPENKVNAKPKTKGRL
ncbi:hypothetical protein [Sphingorhabdus lacus]|uniref:Uncharacterized protein n=1 Tax=Sphingorhabdus lacus TaxID=392610 RepID=A0A6I6L9N7_9SPHN|nr:hypothetical protein [Sphingorhabdus lacus]QGY80817.1 hypothetical protein EUU25_09410 [Sphingorhabdus lacus]